MWHGGMILCMILWYDTVASRYDTMWHADFSATAERQFTLFGNIKTKLRNDLKVQTTNFLMHVTRLN